MHQSLHVELTNSRTLRYRTMAQKGVRRETVRVAVGVISLVSSGHADSSTIEQRVHAALNAFIRADWLLSSPQRSSDTAGYERVTFTATTRVPQGENYNLAERARQASAEGLSLQKPEASYVIPAGVINQAVQDLRLQILAEAQQQAEQFATRSGQKWELADIAYGVHAEDFGHRSGKGAYRSEFDDILDNMDGEQNEKDASAERVRVFADIVLRAGA